MNFGADILVINGEIMWSGDTLATVSELENVNQQSYFRCITDLGESEFFNYYGGRLQSEISKPYTSANKKSAEAEARDILLRVGDENGPGWIEEVIDCQLKLETVDGQQVKVLYAKYRARDVEGIVDSTFVLGGGSNV